MKFIKNIALGVLSILTLSITYGQDLEVKRLRINSKGSEYAPTFYQDGIIFVSHRKTEALNSNYDIDGNYTSDLYYSRVNDEGNFKSFEIFSDDLSTELNEGPSSISRDENWIFFTRGMEGKKKENDYLAIYYSQKNDDGWSEPQPFKYNCQEGEYDVAHPALSVDGNRLFFASNKEGSLGGFDLYYCDKDDRGEWSDPVHMNEMINTIENEGFPFCGDDGRLYFSSSGHSENRGMDILYAVESKGGIWSMPRLMDEPINSDGNDFGIAIEKSGNLGYFSSDRDQKFKDDIYSFSLGAPVFENCLENYSPYTCYTLYDENIEEMDQGAFKYTWVIDDTIRLEGFEVDYCFPGYGDYIIQLEIFDTLTNKLSFSGEPAMISIEKMPQPHIVSPDTIWAGETVEFRADELDHVNFTSDGYYWNINDLVKDKGLSTEYKFKETGEYNIVFGMMNVSNPDEKICVTQQVVVIDDKYLARISGEENMVKQNSISVNEYKKSDYNNKGLVMDTSYFFVQIKESIEQIPLQDEFFSNTEHQITERFARDRARYIYSVGEELSLNEIYPLYAEMVEDGYEEAIIKEDMKVDYDTETTKKGYYMTEEEKDALTTEINSFSNILFDNNEFKIKEESYNNLYQIAEYMFTKNKIRLKVTAHTDSKGSFDHNMTLSQKRAESVVDFFTSLGVSKDRLIFEGKGSTEPIADNSTEAGRKLNRRVEFEIILEEEFGE